MISVRLHKILYQAKYYISLALVFSAALRSEVISICPLSNIDFMKWYLAKVVYRIICGDGHHTAQFDEQLRLLTARHEEEALEKAIAIGMQEEEVFYNDRKQLVQWKFIDITE